MNNIRDSDKGATKEKSSNKAPQPAKQERQKSLDYKLTKLIVINGRDFFTGGRSAYRSGHAGNPFSQIHTNVRNIISIFAAYS